MWRIILNLIRSFFLYIHSTIEVWIFRWPFQDYHRTNETMNESSTSIESTIKSLISVNSDISSNSLENSLNLDINDMRFDSSLPVEIRKLQAMFRLQITDVYRSEDCKILMDYLREFSANLISDQCTPDISQVTDNDNCIEFFRNYVINVTENCGAMLENISQRQYINFIKFVMALWNMSDKSDSLCARMASFEVHAYLIRLLKKINVTSSLLESKKVQLLVMSIVGILHNINNKLHYTRSRCRDENLVRCLLPLASLDISDDLIGLKTAALLLLAFLVNENENSSLNANDDHIVYILTILKETLNSPKQYSKYYGYHSLEILQGLRNIASPDNNKRTLINNDILSLIASVLKPENDVEYQNELVAGLELLWSLSFSKECLRYLNEDKYGLKTRVELLADGNNKDVVLSARGILWNITAQKSMSINNLMLNDAKTPNSNGHVMVSYQHSTQVMMIKIKDKLVANGYKVWMDVDHMRGSFVDAMAEGIQHASVLLLGMCHAFKNSPHCRQEVKYAYTLGIPLVPVMLEPGFTPDGWLGLMCATLIHTEFIDPTKLDQNIVQLQRQLGVLGKVYNRPLSNQDSLDGTYPVTNNGQCSLQCCKEEIVTAPNAMSSHQMTDSMIGSISDLNISVRSDHSSAINQINPSPACLISDLSHDGPHLFRVESSCHTQKVDNVECYMCTQDAQDTTIIHQPRLQVLDWTLTQTMDWLREHSLDPDQYGYPLTSLDGPLLFELAEMRITAPESFFTALKNELNLNFIDKLNFTRALRRLDEIP